jgi:hypothetical protein
LAALPYKPLMKHILQLIIGIVLVTASLSLVGTETGKKLQMRLLGTYLPAAATTLNYDISEYEVWGKSAGNHIHELRVYLKGQYSLKGKVYNHYFLVKSFDFYERKEAKLFAKQNIHPGEPITIYYYPKDPNEAELKPEDEMHLWLDYFFVLPLLTVSVILIFWALGHIFIKKIREQENAVAPPKPPFSIDGKSDVELLDYYYDEDLDAHALQKWYGYYCVIFLFEHGLVVVYDESNHYYCRFYNLEDFLKMNIIDKVIIGEPEINFKDEILAKIKSLMT